MRRSNAGRIRSDTSLTDTTVIRPAADAALDRIVHAAHRITLKGASVRRKRSNFRNEEDSDNGEDKRPVECTPTLVHYTLVMAASLRSG